jgi:Ca-activated chloride channel family protein
MKASIASLVCVICVSCGPGKGLDVPVEVKGEAVFIQKVVLAADDYPRTDRSLSPYLWIPGGDEDVDRLPLESTTAKVQIAGVMARVVVTQVFKNDGDVPIEAEYVFPGSTRAAVHGMRMIIGERIVEAQIQEKEQAKATYEAAKSEGKVASLLEQKRKNVFSMRVANIMPGARIEVELTYSEMLVPEAGVYAFVYPTVVGPRYAGGVHPVEDQWVETPYTPEGTAEMYDFGIEVDLLTAMPIKSVDSPTHDLNAVWSSGSRVHLTPAEPGGGDRDFIVRYSLADDAIESGVLVLDEGDGGYFAVMLEPPPRPRPEQITAREYIFVLDVSGSMYGFPIDTARVLMEDLLGGLRPGDLFNLVLFAGTSFRLSDTSLPATEENIANAVQVVMNAPAGGGTELLAALVNAMSVPQTDRMSRSVVVVTDGYVGVEAESYKYVRENLGDASVFAFGIGSSVNRELIESLARAGMGEPFVVLDPDEAAAEAHRFREYIRAPVLTDIEVSFQGMDVSEVLPGSVPDLMASRPVVLIGKFTGEPTGTIVLTGTTGESDYKQTITVKDVLTSEGTEPLRVLWARKWVDLLEDELSLVPGDEKTSNSILELGIAYSILTSRTSFVAADTLVVNDKGELVNVEQPLPLPKGVSNAAVGGVDSDADGIPDSNDACPNEPETYNGKQDGDGCPDSGTIEISSCNITVMDKIYFEPDSAKIMGMSESILDMVAKVMIENPQVLHVHIAGHSDVKEAKKKKNKGLALKRAQAVMAYLVEKGVQPERLSAGGYDALCPVDKETSPGALEKNRRVEFRITKTDAGCADVEVVCAAAASLLPPDAICQ